MEGYIAEIRSFAGNFNPRGWMFCNGALLSISQNTALFSLIGTTYGGNGQTTFALPDLRGRVSSGAQFSQGPGLPAIQLGEMSGTNSVTLLSTNLPAHTHNMNASADAPTQATAQGASLASQVRGGATMPTVYAAGATSQVPMGSTTGFVGSNAPVNNMQPYLGMNYIICIEGIYPSRN